MIFEKEEAAQTRRNAEKLATARFLLANQDSVFLHIGPATFDADDLHIPARLRSQVQVVFQIGLNMPVPIPDLRLDDEGFSGTLSFKGQPYTCYVPWRAVFAVVGSDTRGRVWTEDMPSPLAREIASDASAAERRREIKLVHDDPDTATTNPYLKPVKGEKRERPAWLKVIEGEKKD